MQNIHQLGFGLLSFCTSELLSSEVNDVVIMMKSTRKEEKDDQDVNDVNDVKDVQDERKEQL
jgi:hypothetical protein